MVGGAPPDIDIDFCAVERKKVIQWVSEKWGKRKVANIITHGTFQPKSLAKSWYRVTEGTSADLSKILKEIPKAKFGKEPSYEEVFKANPALRAEAKYGTFVDAADKIGGMVSNFGIHAAGVIISDFPIEDVVPTWQNKSAECISQFNKDEVEDLGLIKFDFLGIDNLTVIKECKRLIKRDSKEKLPWDWEYKFPDGNEAAYKMMAAGLLSGIFQFETSEPAKRYIAKIQPEDIEELSDISALNRPGPQQAKLPQHYIQNKAGRGDSENVHEKMLQILAPTQNTLVYQEQVMRICSDVAGFSLREADDVRRAMGKKKVKVLEGYEKQFVQGFQDSGLTKDYAEEQWHSLLGFADYCLAYDTLIVCRVGPWSFPFKIGWIVETKQPVHVLSKGENGNNYFQEVVQWHDKGIKEVFEYTFDNGETVTCTPDHKFMTAEGMVPIEKIFEKGLDLVKL